MRKTILFLAVLALACIAYMAWPAYDLTQFVRAIERGDTTTAAHYVNLARVRVSLTEQITGSRDQSDGFITDRDYASNAVASDSWLKSALGTTDVLLASSDRPYGANLFYGNYNSWERTKGWLAIGQQQLGARTAASFGYRRHTDEFILFRDSYEDAWRKGYRDLVPANQYNADYSLVATARIEPLLRRIRNSMSDAGMICESAKGECNLGQHEIAFLYDDALVTCDNHSI